MSRRHVGVCAACKRPARIEARGLCHRDYAAARRTGTLETYPRTGKLYVPVKGTAGKGVVLPTLVQTRVEQSIARTCGRLDVAAELCGESRETVRLVWEFMEAAAAEVPA